MDIEPKNQSDTKEGLIASLMAVSPVESQRVSLDIAPAAIFKVLFTLGALWLISRVFPVLILVVLSLMLVATFNPLVRKLQIKLGRSWAILAIVMALVILLLGSLALLIPLMFSQAAMLSKNAPLYAQQIQQTLAHQHINVNVQKQVADWTGKAGDPTPQLVGIFSSVFGVVSGFVTVAILTIYLLIEGPQAATSVLRLLPRKERLPARKLAADIGTHVGGYMRGQLITSALAGGFCFVSLLILEVPAALALAALAALADAIPLIGLLIALVPAAVMALTISPARALIVIVVYLVYHQIEDHYIAPRVYGNALGLSLSVIVISILVSVQLMGMLGALLALPVAAAVPTIIAYIQEWQESHGAPDISPLAGSE
jgi:predicted PurR-regulated permease PerM